jgi:dTDP-glucose 4,6-dehydratase
MRVLITGGAGFIGSNLVAHLLRRHDDIEIVVLDALTYAGRLDNLTKDLFETGRLTFWQGDVGNSEIVRRLIDGVDAVAHLAAETHVARSIYANRRFYETDVLGTQAIASAVLDANVSRFVHVSTSEVYGTAESDPMTEEHPLNPRSPYASAKTGADRLVYSYAAAYEIPALILRPFNNYGPRQHLEKAIPRFITNALRDEPLVVHGDGTCTRDWVYTGDVALAIDNALHAPAEIFDGRAINIGTGIDTSVSSVAEAVLDALGKSRELIQYSPDRPGQVDRHISNVDTAERCLNWAARTDLAEGLKRTVDWYVDNEAWWEPMLDMREVPIMFKNGETIHY